MISVQASEKWKKKEEKEAKGRCYDLLWNSLYPYLIILKLLLELYPLLSFCIRDWDELGGN
jgi:hypothetical protein